MKNKLNNFSQNDCPLLEVYRQSIREDSLESLCANTSTEMPSKISYDLKERMRESRKKRISAASSHQSIIRSMFKIQKFMLHNA